MSWAAAAEPDNDLPAGPAKDKAEGNGAGDRGDQSAPAADGAGGQASREGSAGSESNKAMPARAAEEEKAQPKLAPDDKRPYADAAVKHYNRGVELHQSGFLNQAIVEYRGAIDADRRMEEAYSNLGLIYAAQHNYAKASEAFNKALSLKPARPTTLNGLGTVLYARGKVKEAMEKWRQAIAIDPNFASAYYNMGNAYENEKDSQGAFDTYVKAIKVNPEMADAYYRLGTLMNKDKHAAPASLLLSRAIELSPEADFARDAKKQLRELDAQFAKEESEEPEVQMNVMPPPGSESLSPGSAPALDKSGSGQKMDVFIEPSRGDQGESQ